MIGSGDLERDIRENMFAPSRDLAPASQRVWASKLAGDLSLAETHVRKRACLSSIRNNSLPTSRNRPVVEKQASAADKLSDVLARSYALYKLAFLAAQTDDVPLTAQMVIRQNYAG
jgi:hypothetical protein